MVTGRQPGEVKIANHVVAARYRQSEGHIRLVMKMDENGQTISVGGMQLDERPVRAILPMACFAKLVIPTLKPHNVPTEAHWKETREAP
ncbi:hypothetical protein D3C87_1025400 [compost metagenome]